MTRTVEQEELVLTYPRIKNLTTVNIVIADEHPIIRLGMKSLLREEQYYKVVGETEDGLEAIQLVKQLEPDILIVDLVLKGLSGIEVTRQVSRLKVKTKVIVFSVHNTGHYILDAIRAGAMGYVLKQTDLMELTLAINQVMNGHHYLSGPLADFVVDIYATNGDVQNDSYNTLTNREKEILQLVALGNTNNEIDNRLCISRRTVEVHRTNIIKKLGLRAPHVDLARYAIERELIENPDAINHY